MCIFERLIAHESRTLTLSCIFPGNSRGTGKFPQFDGEPVPQKVPAIQINDRVPQDQSRGTVCQVPGNGLSGTSIFEHLFTRGEQERKSINKEFFNAV